MPTSSVDTLDQIQTAEELSEIMSRAAGGNETPDTKSPVIKANTQDELVRSFFEPQLKNL